MSGYSQQHMMNGSGDGPLDLEDGIALRPSIEDILQKDMQGNIKNRTPIQQVILQGDDSCNSFSIYGRNVNIVMSQASMAEQSTAGSNKVKISPIVNYDWEHKYHYGNLVAVHRSGIFVAYSLKGRVGGIVRIISRRTAERALVKGFVGMVSDLSFAHLLSVILGAVDEMGNMFVYEILEEESGKIEPMPLIQVNRPAGSPKADVHRLIWCPFQPENEDTSGTTIEENSLTDDMSKLLVLTHDEVAEIWHLDLVMKEYGSGPLISNEVEDGVVVIRSHTKAILDATFSPEGSALATASMDGDVKFFQTQLGDLDSPRCLHQWQPHEGRPVSFLAFLDDHKNACPEVQFWKYAVTGGHKNTEIKVWGCESWNCLQCITFSMALDLPAQLHFEPCLKAVLDLAANYVVLTDIKQKVLYVLQMHQDRKANTALACSVSEFLLTQPCLSFDILDASRRKLRKSQDHEAHIGDMTTGEIRHDDDDIVSKEVDGPDVGVLLRLCCVHTKALQELEIRFKPETSVPQPSPPSISSVSHEEVALRDGLSDMSVDVTASDADGAHSDRSHYSEPGPNDSTHHSNLSYHSSKSAQSHHSLESTQSEPKPLLMTPDAFTASSPRKSEAQQSLDAIHSSSGSSFTHVTAMNEESVKQQSPGSSVTLTPASSHDMASPQQTPLSAPGRKAEAPTELGSKYSPKGISSPTTKGGSSTAMGAGRPPSEGEAASSVDFSMSAGSGFNRRTLLKSTGSSSSTSLEVSEILGEVCKHQPFQEYEDGTENQGLHQQYQAYEDEQGNQGVKDSTEDVEELQEQEMGAEGNEGSQGGVAEGQLIDVTEEPPQTSFEKGEWPKPPNVGEVTAEAERLAAEAIHRATAAALKLQGEAMDEEAMADDVQVEEEEPTEEEEEEEDEDEEDDEDGEPEQAQQQAAPVMPDTLVTESSDVFDSTSSGSSPKKPHRYTEYRRKQRLSPSGEASPAAGADKDTAEKLILSVQELMKQVDDQQQRFMASLRQVSGGQQRQEEGISRLNDRIDMLEGALAARVTGALSQHSQTESHRLKAALSERESQEQQKHDRLISTMQQSVGTSVAQRLEKTVKYEMKNTVVPNVTAVMQPLKEQLHTEMAQKLTATDALMKENISKMVRSKHTVESIGQAAASALQGQIETAYREAFQNVVVPSFDRACQNLFHQVNDTFQKGTKEYHQQLQQRQEEQRDPLLQQLRELVEEFRSASQQMQASVISTVKHELDTRVHGYLTSLQDNLSSQVQTIVKQELSTALKEQESVIGDSVMSAMRASGVTPTATPLPSLGFDSREVQKAHLLTLLNQGQLNAAFQEALSASNLELVMFVCDNVNPTQVFNQVPCPLQQPVLLSLIQQLSADLRTDTEVKHKFLEEAVMNLDTNNELTKGHLPLVLGALCQKLLAFIRTEPQHRMTRSMKMLLMAAQSLLK